MSHSITQLYHSWLKCDHTLSVACATYTFILNNFIWRKKNCGDDLAISHHVIVILLWWMVINNNKLLQLVFIDFRSREWIIKFDIGATVTATNFIWFVSRKKNNALRLHFIITNIYLRQLRFVRLNFNIDWTCSATH